MNECFPQLVNPEVTVEINNPAFTIGRAISCDYVVENLLTSRQHCVLKKNGNKWTLFDKSSNGTWVNAVQVGKNKFVDLKDGDLIVLGAITFTFREFQPPPPPLWNADGSILDLTSRNPVAGVASNSNNVNSGAEVESEIIELDDSCLNSSECIVVNAGDAQGAPELRQEEPNPPHVDVDVMTGEGVIGTPELEEVGMLLDMSENSSAFTNCLEPPKCLEPHAGKGDVQPFAEDRLKPVAEVGESQLKPEVPSTSNLVMDTVEDELTCSICSEVFIKAVTLNCMHTFCKYCLDQWKRSKLVCPICRSAITFVTPTLVLNNYIEKVVEKQSEEYKEMRKELVAQRETATSATTSSSADANINPTVIEISEEEGSSTDGTEEDYDEYDLDYDEFDESWSGGGYNGIRGRYYGGYGRCYICNQTGHWANGCPLKRRP